MSQSLNPKFILEIPNFKDALISVMDKVEERGLASAVLYDVDEIETVWVKNDDEDVLEEDATYTLRLHILSSSSDEEGDEEAAESLSAYVLSKLKELLPKKQFKELTQKMTAIEVWGNGSYIA